MAGYDFKSADDVQEYLKNLHIEYQFGCLSEKKPEVCHLLGDYLESIKEDHVEAAKVYKTNCDTKNFARSCTTYGSFRLAGKGCEKDHVDAYNYMLKGCNLNDVRGCLYAGSFAVTEEKLEETRAAQISHGVEMLKKACDANVEKACFHLSCVYLGGIQGFIEKDLQEAYILSLKSCEFGNPYACANVSIMHKKGDGVQQNLDLANVFKIRAEKLLAEIQKAQRQIKFHQGLDS